MASILGECDNKHTTARERTSPPVEWRGDISDEGSFGLRPGEGKQPFRERVKGRDFQEMGTTLQVPWLVWSLIDHGENRMECTGEAAGAC